MGAVILKYLCGRMEYHSELIASLSLLPDWPVKSVDSRSVSLCTFDEEETVTSEWRSLPAGLLPAERADAHVRLELRSSLNPTPYPLPPTPYPPTSIPYPLPPTP